MKSLIDKFKIYGLKRSLRYGLYEVYMFIMRIVKASYSQKGEDLVIDKLFEGKSRGFYVDIGASDPKRFSNTMHFYMKGWRGINIEPDLDCFEKIKKARLRDTNLNIGIGNTNSTLTFFRFTPNTISTFSKVEAEKYEQSGFKLLNKIEIKVRKLKDVLKDYTSEVDIDFMSVDTEGYDVEVLKGNDWDKFKPKVICIESMNANKEKNSAEEFLIAVGYQKYFQSRVNSIFVLKEFRRV